MNIKGNILKIRWEHIVIVLLVIQNILLATSYNLDNFFPIVQMGTRTWPLYFFILDFITIILTILSIAIMNKYNLLLRIIVGILLTLPFISIYATYSDLTRRNCLTSECINYQEPLDLKDIKLINNVK